MKAHMKHVALNFFAILIGVVLVCVLLVGIEFFLELRVPPQSKDNNKEFLMQDPVLGRKIKANYRGSHYLEVGGEEIFSVQYAFDEHSRRITPVAHEEERQGSALFFGCSFVFGFGVEQEDSLPAAFGRECETLFPLNFATPGYGPQHMWVQLQQPHFEEQIPGEKGVVLYGFIHDHLNRLMGEPNLVANWGTHLPWLDISEEGVVYRGLMKDRESFLSLFRQALIRRHLGRFILNRLNLLPVPDYTEEEAYRSFARLFADIKERIKTILPGYELIVFAFPGDFEETQLKDALEEYDIPFLDYSLVYQHLEGELTDYFFDDSPGTRWGHPKPRTYAHVAELLAKDLAEYCGEHEEEAP